MQGLTTLSLSVGGHERRCLVHVPAGHDGRRALPVVLMLHGAGATAAWMLDETGWAATADREGFLVAVPEGTPADPSWPPSFRANPQLWNDGSAWGLRRADVDDVAFIDALLDELATRFPVESGRIYVTGFSNGAGMTFRLGTDLSHRLAALAPLAGNCWQKDPRPSRPLPTLYMVGTDDPLMPLAGGEVRTPWGWTEHKPPLEETLTRWASALGCSRVPQLVREANGVREVFYEPSTPTGAGLLACAIQGLGHHWPGGRGQLSRRRFGPTSKRVQANDLLWRFFARQARP